MLSGEVSTGVLGAEDAGHVDEAVEVEPAQDEVLVDKAQFGLVAVRHVPVELPLQKEGNDEPVDSN